MLNYYVPAFFKTDTLSNHFVLLSAERGPFFAPSQAMKKSIFGSFRGILRSRRLPDPFPVSPHIFLFRGGSYAWTFLR